MPAGFGYGAVGRSLMRVMGRGARGAGGLGVQGAILGGAAGGLYGAGSDRRSVLGGLMGGALKGSMLFGGAGIARGAFRGGRGMHPRMGFLRGAIGAGKSDSMKMMAFGRRSRRLIGRTFRMARNPIKSTMRG